MALSKIITGGQTGVDRGALDAAIAHCFPCGGWCPPGRIAEDGPIAELYPLEEMPRGGYRLRTIQNIVDSDATVVIYFGELEGGTEMTVLHCIRKRKPYKLIDALALSAADGAKAVAEFVSTHTVARLNIAGPRQSKVPAAHSYAVKLVSLLLDPSQQPSPAD